VGSNLTEEPAGPPLTGPGDTGRTNLPVVNLIDLSRTPRAGKKPGKSPGLKKEVLRKDFPPFSGDKKTRGFGGRIPLPSVPEGGLKNNKSDGAYPLQPNNNKCPWVPPGQWGGNNPRVTAPLPGTGGRWVGIVPPPEAVGGKKSLPHGALGRQLVFFPRASWGVSPTKNYRPKKRI